MGWGTARIQNILERLNRQSLLEISRGNVAGSGSTIIRGHNPDQSAASGDVDIAEFGDLSYLDNAETMNIVSDDANDDAGDTGLRTLLIQGVRGDGSAVQEIITMNGTSDVETVNSYLRINSMIGLTVGSSGWNEGTVNATSTISATIQDEMSPMESISQSSHFTVPLGQSLYLQRVEFNAAKIVGGGNPEIEFKGLARVGGAGNAWLQLFDKTLDTAVADEITIDVPTPTRITQRTDIRMRSDTDTNSTETRSRMYGLLIND